MNPTLGLDLAMLIDRLRQSGAARTAAVAGQAAFADRGMKPVISQPVLRRDGPTAEDLVRQKLQIGAGLRGTQIERQLADLGQ